MKRIIYRAAYYALLSIALPLAAVSYAADVIHGAFQRTCDFIGEPVMGLADKCRREVLR